jgi:hypothetical protein
MSDIAAASCSVWTPSWPRGAGPAGGGRIDAAAGEVHSGARLAACRWHGPGACEKASK